MGDMAREDQLQLARVFFRRWVNSDEACCGFIYDSVSAAGAEHFYAMTNDFAKFAVYFHRMLLEEEA